MRIASVLWFKKKTEVTLIWKWFVLAKFIVASISCSNNIFTFDLKKAFLTNWKRLAVQVLLLNGAFITYQKEKWIRKKYSLLFLDINYKLWWNVFVWILRTSLFSHLYVVWYYSGIAYFIYILIYFNTRSWSLILVNESKPEI